MDPEEKLLAISRARDRQLAELLLLTIGVAAETEPLLLRIALEKVFDLKAVEDMAKRAMLVATEAQRAVGQAAAEVRILVEGVHRDLDGIDQRIDELQRRLDKASRVVQAIKVKK